MVLRMTIGGRSVDSGIADRQIVQRAMLVRCPGIVRQLLDSYEQCLSRRCKLFSSNLLGAWDAANERINVERVDLVEADNRHHEPIAQLRRGDGTAYANDYIHVCRARSRTDGFHQ